VVFVQSRTDLVTKFRIYSSVGRQADAAQLMKIHGDLYSKPLPHDLVKRIFAIGEGQPGEMFDYGCIEDFDKRTRVWEMQEPRTAHAGGAGKNRKVDVTITLPAENYKLRYKSDDSHAFDHWNSLPPDINFWGIAVDKN
jgi:hypothetical protein